MHKNRLLEIEVRLDKNPELDIDRLDCKIGHVLSENGIDCFVRDDQRHKYGSLSIVEPRGW